MKLVNRGNPSIMKDIANKAKAISESNGLSKIGGITPAPVQEGGAYASMMAMRRAQNNPQPTPILPNVPGSGQTIPSVGVNLSEGVLGKKLQERLLESVETLSTTKEYFNATSSLFTLYSMGMLTEGVMQTISEEDLKEIKALIKEFKLGLDKY